ncbi:MAG: hypothetical protein ACHP8A_05105, partial [Terriglobales bacterium]
MEREHLDTLPRPQYHSIFSNRPISRYPNGPLTSAHIGETVATVFYERDVNPDALKGKTITILGYGSQGHAQALNL